MDRISGRDQRQTSSRAALVFFILYAPQQNAIINSRNGTFPLIAGVNTMARRSPIIWIGCGCATLLMLFILFIAVIVGVIFLGASSLITSSEPYQHAITQAKESDKVKEVLGEPMEEGFVTSSSFNINNDSGTAQMSIPVSGPNGSGVVDLNATMFKGKWTYHTITFTNDTDSSMIDLLNPDRPTVEERLKENKQGKRMEEVIEQELEELTGVPLERGR